MSVPRLEGDLAVAEPDENELRERMLESVERLGWREGMAAFLHALPVEHSLHFRRQLFSDDAGWIFLLPHAGLERVLCIDAFSGSLALALARMHSGLQLAQFCRRDLAAIAGRLEAAGAGFAGLTELDPRELRLPFEDGSFDAVLLADPGLLPDRASMPQFLAEARRVLAPEGFCCLKVRNRFAYGRLRALVGGQWPLRPTRTTLRQIEDACRDLGFKGVDATPVLMAGDRVLEVACARDYEPSTMINGTLGLLKSMLLGPGLAKWFAPGFIVTCSKGRPHPRFIDALMAHLVADGTLPGRLQVRRYMLPSAKAILSVGRPDDPDGQAIIVLPVEPWVLTRRRHEAAILTGLARLPAIVSSVVPRMVAHGALHGQPYHVITQMPGQVIDSAIPELTDATLEACDWLAAFHALTARPQTVTPELFAVLFGEPIARAAAELGGGVDAVTGRIRSLLEQRVLGREIRTVWTHGDFKIENILFDHRTGRIRGVIDWDLSERQGLPLHDLLYLLAFNRELREGSSFEAVFFDAVLPARPTTEERSLIARYRARVGIDSEIIPALAVMAWMHHVGRRMILDTRYRGLIDQLKSGFEKIEAALSAMGSRGAAHGD